MLKYQIYVLMEDEEEEEQEEEEEMEEENKREAEERPLHSSSPWVGQDHLYYHFVLSFT